MAAQDRPRSDLVIAPQFLFTGRTFQNKHPLLSNQDHQQTDSDEQEKDEPYIYLLRYPFIH